MEVRIRPTDRNGHPVTGLLVKGASVRTWAIALQALGLSAEAVTVFPLPGAVANSLWGCLIALPPGEGPEDPGPYEAVQLAEGLLYLPARAELYPRLAEGELARLLGGKQHLLHPDTGFVELEAPVEWAALLHLPEPEMPALREPAASVFIPARVKTFQVASVPAEEAIDKMEQQFPKQEPLADKPLSLWEQAKLLFYKGLFKKDKDAKPGAGGAVSGKPLLGALEKLRGLFGAKDGGWANKLQDDFEDLERRNQKQLDRLMDLLQQDPLGALRYAMPLDESGAARGGGGAGRFDLLPRWLDFSLFGNSGSGGGGTYSIQADTYLRLQQQYRQTAQELIRRGEYHKAAFVYLKLLKDYRQAAATLQQGGFYQEAASLYIKFCNDRRAAAECYEQGRMTGAAIELYKELGLHEKVGDLYRLLRQEREALHHYNIVVDEHIGAGKFLQAAQLQAAKMQDDAAANATLLRGFRAHREAEACLRTYCERAADDRQLQADLEELMRNDVSAANYPEFLRVLQHVFERRARLSAPVRELAYDVVLRYVEVHPNIVSALSGFNPGDKELVKDTMRFHLGRKRR